MTIDDLNNLDYQEMGNWPLAIRAGLILIICLILIVASWYYDINPLREEHAKHIDKEEELKATFETKQKKVANLDGLKQQLLEMEQSFGDMLKQLPDQTEVAGLIVDISQTGLAAGLEFELFKPGSEKLSEFYAELPIQLKVIGRYHQFGKFVSDLAALSRIVTTHDVSIKSSGTVSKKKKGTGDSVSNTQKTLIMQATAKTYRALNEGEGK